MGYVIGCKHEREEFERAQSGWRIDSATEHQPIHQQSFMGAQPSPLSSRAQPRDLQCAYTANKGPKFNEVLTSAWQDLRTRRAFVGCVGALQIPRLRSG